MNSGDQILQAGQNNWPSYGTNAGEKKNERMVMPVEEEEESSTRTIHDEAQTTTSIVDANYTSGEKSTMKTVELADISHKEVTINIYLYTIVFWTHRICHMANIMGSDKCRNPKFWVLFLVFLD